MIKIILFYLPNQTFILNNMSFSGVVGHLYFLWVTKYLTAESSIENRLSRDTF
jgi:hypothetical protein